MAAGGIYDHLGGGFARYATDQKWLVPHFEKMLYDNALLARTYLHAWQLTAIPRYAEVVRETLDWAARELRVPAGGAFASSPGRGHRGPRGRHVRLDRDEIRAVLGDTSPLFELAYGVTPRRQLGGRHDPVPGPRRRGDRDHVRHRQGRGRGAAGEDRGGSWRRATRGRSRRATTRCSPSWNGLMLAAYAEAGRFLPVGRATPRSREEAAGVPAGSAARAGRAPQAVVEGRAGAPRRRRWRTTRTSRMGCWRCTRPRSTSAGSWRPGS